jgi:hypothetical protein
MPAGKIELKNGASVNYDDVEVRGGVTVYKASYTHDVRAIPSSDIKSIDKGEWHQTPFGSCKSLSNSEVDSAVDRFTGKKR